MNINELLKKEFEIINKAYWEKEANINFLRIEVNLKDLAEIAKLSNNISKFLDVNYDDNAGYYLDIFSPGTDIEFDPIDSKKHIDKIIQVELKISIKGMDAFIGKLLSYEDKKIIVKWNAKGQFRKQKIELDNIKKIKTYANIKKDK